MSLQLRLPPVPASEQNYVIGLQHREHHGIAARLLKKEWKYWSVNDKKSLEKALRQSHEELEIQSARFVLENVPGFAESKRVNFATREKTSDTLESRASCRRQSVRRPPGTVPWVRPTTRWSGTT